jgi:hypothetical protein
MGDSNGLLIADLDAIIGLHADPVVRNLLITQSYHDLSTAMGWLLGVEHANWCTFATWASRTAGSFIRDDEVPAHLRAAIEHTPSYLEAKARLGRLGFAFDRDCLLRLPGEIVGDVSAQITLGNLKVYAELGPLFALMIRAFGQDAAAPDPLAAVLATLSEGPTEQGGQDLLRLGVANYFHAINEADAKKKAERILLANGQIGLHEQIRLQPYIADSINAPVAASVNNVAASILRPLALPLRHRAEPLVDAILYPLIAALERDWNAIATRELMTLTVPGTTLHLGSPLPPLPDQSMCPAILRTIDDPDLRVLLQRYDCLSVEPGASTRNWVLLAQRMAYILSLFRSRQMVQDFFQQPFADRQRAAILDRRVPAGPLA